MKHNNVDVTALRRVIANIRSELDTLLGVCLEAESDLNPGSFWVCDTKLVVRKSMNDTIEYINNILKYLKSGEGMLNEIDKEQLMENDSSIYDVKYENGLTVIMSHKSESGVQNLVSPVASMGVRGLNASSKK